MGSKCVTSPGSLRKFPGRVRIWSPRSTSTQCDAALENGLEITARANCDCLTDLATHSYITSIIKGICWLPICYQAEFKVIVLTYEVLSAGNSLSEGAIISALPSPLFKICQETPSCYMWNLGTWYLEQGLPGGGKPIVEYSSLKIWMISFLHQQKTYFFLQAFRNGECVHSQMDPPGLSDEWTAFCLLV